MTEQKYFETKNELYQKEIIKSLRKEISNLIHENESLKEEIVNLRLIIRSLEAKSEHQGHREKK